MKPPARPRADPVESARRVGPAARANFGREEGDPRLARVRRLAWLMDKSIPIGGGHRIGLDPILGLWPGAGDAIGAVVSLFVVYEAAKLGTPVRVLGRMVVNILIESLVGTVPLLGDVFDAAWKSNVRNLRLLESNYRPDRPTRPLGRIAVGLVVIGILLVALALAAAAIVIAALWQLLQ